MGGDARGGAPGRAVTGDDTWRLIWQLAGIVGVDPRPLTLRELVWMSEARRREAWSHTASLLALTANVHRNPQKRPRPFSPAEFHPLLVPDRRAVLKTGIDILKRVFVERE